MIASELEALAMTLTERELQVIDSTSFPVRVNITIVPQPLDNDQI